MLEYLLLGCSLAFAAAIQPGPLQAFLVSRVALAGWRRTIPASLSPLLSDGPIALVALLALRQLPVWFQDLLRAAGGLLLIYLAWSAFVQWQKPEQLGASGSAPRTFLEAALVNLLNPNPYLGWTLVLGPAVLAAWNENGSCAVALLLAFYGTMVITLAGFILLAGTARCLGSRGQRALVGISAAVLAGLGVYLLSSTIWRLGAV
ncbi:MAG: LysE family transporter [Planctomycetes bacterium]|nr:LysE family transporter [Planctomycetota bacterium]